ncbi:hypothetical protein KF913_08485 [Candidatus Obscuribacterales bacterium]|nr:hypothetical protein [Candidatus Obscuribacterales bacterium]
MPEYQGQKQELETAFENLIKQVPGISDVRIESTSNGGILAADIDQPDQLHGFEAAFVTPSNEKWIVCVLTRASGEPRLIRESCARLLALINKSPERDKLYPVVAATYISKRSAEICKEMNVGYLDLSGNCRFAFDSIFIEREVMENRKVEKRPLRSLFSPKSSRVVRIMLGDPSRVWQVQDLSETAEISIGLASKVKQKLLDLDFAMASSGGLKLKEPEDVLHEWSREYSYKDNESLGCYAPGGMHELESQLQNYCQLKNISYALTLFSASNRIAPFVRGISMSSAFVDADLDQVAKDLGWKPVPSGANFLLLKPLDEFILRDTRTSKDWTGMVVSDLQLYLDLASHKTRGQEAAEFLFEQKIRPRWKAKLGDTG